MSSSLSPGSFGHGGNYLHLQGAGAYRGHDRDRGSEPQAYYSDISSDREGGSGSGADGDGDYDVEDEEEDMEVDEGHKRRLGSGVGEGDAGGLHEDGDEDEEESDSDGDSGYSGSDVDSEENSDVEQLVAPTRTLFVRVSTI